MSARPLVLVVDDSAEVQAALRAALRKDRDRWELLFCSGDEATSIIAGHPVDVVLTELRMRGTDGLGVLRACTELRPAAARVLFAASLAEEQVAEALSLSHRYLGKPSSTAEIRAELLSLTRLIDWVPDRDLRAAIGLGSLGVSGFALQRLRELHATLDPDIAEVVDLLTHQTMLASRVLAFANSGYFGRAREVGTVHEAVVHLGTKLVLELSLVWILSGVIANEEQRCNEDPEVMAMVRAIERTARRPPGRTLASCHVCDLGRCLLRATNPQGYPEVDRRVAAGAELLAAELDVFGVDHARAGAYLLELHGVPTELVEVARWHHQPSARDEAADLLDAVGIVHIASALVDEQRGHAGVVIDEDYVDSLPEAYMLARWRQLAESLVHPEGGSRDAF